MAKLRVTTRSGSVYVIDRETLTFTRESDHDVHLCDASLLSDLTGRLDIMPEPVVGNSMVIFPDGHWIVTSVVVSIEEIE